MYSRQELIDIGLRCSMDIMSNFQRSHNILDYITRPADHRGSASQAGDADAGESESRSGDAGSAFGLG